MMSGSLYAHRETWNCLIRFATSELDRLLYLPVAGLNLTVSSIADLLTPSFDLTAGLCGLRRSFSTRLT